MKHGRIFFTADQHFGHSNILKYCNRPFKDADEMDAAIIKNYNYLINDKDIVFFLGDLGTRTRIEMTDILDKLKGKKILIMGNHDRRGVMSYYHMGFDAVLEQATIKLGSSTVTLSHRPRRTLYSFFRLCLTYIFNDFKNRPLRHNIRRIAKEWKATTYSNKIWNLCGHSHTAFKIDKKRRNINCGVDVWDFKPVLFNQIVNIIQEEE